MNAPQIYAELIENAAGKFDPGDDEYIPWDESNSQPETMEECDGI